MTRELTGRHVFCIVVAAFAVIIAANMTMLFAAKGSFPGLVVKNSYVAGQGWDARSAAQRELGWATDVSYKPGTLTIAIRDAASKPVRVVAPIVVVGRPATTEADRNVDVVATSDAFEAPIELAPGRWRINLTVQGPPAFTTVAEIWVPEAR